MRVKKKKRFSVFFWTFILIFLAIILTFPKWITVFYPLPHEDVVFSAALEQDVDPYLVFAIIRAESKFQSEATSPVGAKGLMQIMPETGEWIADQMELEDFDVDDLHDVDTNVRLGSWYLSNLSSEFEGNVSLTVASYNAGRGTVKQWMESGQWQGDSEELENIPFPETRQYVKNVLKNYEAYKVIYQRRI